MAMRFFAYSHSLTFAGFKLITQQLYNCFILSIFLFDKLDWCHEIQSFSGSVVDFVLYHIDVFICYFSEIRTFNEVLPDQAVSVFVSPSFPGVIWPGEEDVHSQ